MAFRLRGAFGPLFARLLLLAVLAQFLAACSSLRFYQQAVSGQLSLMRAREPIDQLLSDERLSPELKAKLERVQELREFAGNQLGLPVQGQYTSYVDLGRPYAVWNVFAAPEFSIQPLEWCFPIAGCVSYRGYFNEADAREFAGQLREQGLDVFVGGIAAYSSLGWFSDPVLSSFVTRADWQLASLIFHELAHQLVYVPGDTQFNESFATAVEMEGLSRWLDHEYSQPEQQSLISQVITFRAREAQFVALIQRAAADLGELYAGNHDQMALRRLKKQRLDELQADYFHLKEQWGGYEGYDQWFNAGLNNAQLSTVTLYNRHLPFFQHLLQNHGGDLESFYREVKEISKMPKQSREAMFVGAEEFSPP